MDTSDRTPVAPEIINYYAAGAEMGRLFRGINQLERARTEEQLSRHLPPTPAVILDVGGGPGVYAHWLAAQGYTVHLVDPVPLHVEEATRVGQEHPGQRLASARLGDARQLAWADGRVDAVLLLGPLYHLIERDDRLRALGEARRVVRPGGLIFVAALSRFASLFAGLVSGFPDDADLVRIVEHDLRTGQRHNPSAYCHRPDELQAEVREAGLAIKETVGLKGPGGRLVRDFERWWDDPARRERLLAAVRAVEREPALLGLGPHIMVIAQMMASERPAHSSSVE